MVAVTLVVAPPDLVPATGAPTGLALALASALRESQLLPVAAAPLLVVVLVLVVILVVVALVLVVVLDVVALVVVTVMVSVVKCTVVVVELVAVRSPYASPPGYVDTHHSCRHEPFPSPIPNHVLRREHSTLPRQVSADCHRALKACNSSSPASTILIQTD